MKNYYETLEVPQNASSTDINRSYHNLALKWHPDKNKDNEKEATEKFELISEAYQTLIDDGRRNKYDTSINKNNDNNNNNSSSASASSSDTNSSSTRRYSTTRGIIIRRYSGREKVSVEQKKSGEDIEVTNESRAYVSLTTSPKINIINHGIASISINVFLSGSISIKNYGIGKIDVTTKGPGNIKIDQHGKGNISITQKGSGKIYINNCGAGSIDISQCGSNEVTLVTSGAGDIYLNFTSGKYAMSKTRSFRSGKIYINGERLII